MRYLGLALYAEGAYDYALLLPLLRRLCEDLCSRLGEHPVEVGDVFPLDDPRGLDDASRAARIATAATAAAGAWDVLFVHTDAASDAPRARAERVDPAASRLSVLQGRRCVAVVPVRETEAWTLVDGDALRAAFGASEKVTDEQLGVPRHAREVERIGDPKVVLRAALLASGARRTRPDEYLANLGERVSLERLRAVPAFAELHQSLERALVELRFLRPSA